MNSFLNGKPPESHAGFSTLGIDHFIRTFQLSDGSLINCLIYDTCGQERYNSINETYYKKADAALLVYSIADKNSFEKINNYYVKEINERCKDNIPILLLGNKTDLNDKRQVTVEQGIELALKEKYEFKESSCYENKNVAGAFETLIERWNFQNQKKQIKYIPRLSSTKGFKRNFTEVNFDDDIDKTDMHNSDDNIKRANSFNLDGANMSNIVLSIDDLDDKKKKKCCK